LRSLRPGRQQRGYDLREVRRTEKAVLVHCLECHHRWWSRNKAALGGVLTKEK
jgi:hypothetical protein